MSKTDKTTYMTAWQKQAELFRIAAAEGDPQAPVSSCPDWNLDDLVRHLVVVNKTIARQVVGDTALEPAALVPDGNATEQLDQSAEDLHKVLNGVALEDHAWHPFPHPKTAKYWFRRLVCETAVHRWDAQLAIGSPEPIEQPIAVDGITEVLGSFLPTAWRTREHDDVSAVAGIVANDVNRQWYVRMRGDNVALLDSGSVEQDQVAEAARANGSASDLLLALWGRVPFSVVDVSGDLAVLEALKM